MPDGPRPDGPRRIAPLAAPPDAVVPVPGSKSLTNRALVIGALAQGTTRLSNALFSDDTVVMVEALRALGFDVDVDPADLRMTVCGLGGRIPADAAELYVGNAGTAARFLTAMVALGRGRYRLNGAPRMRERPIQDLTDALNALGGAVMSPSGCPPVVVEARGLRGGAVTVRGETSSQFVSAVLMVAPYAAEAVDLSVDGALVGAPYVEMTLAVMREFGARIDRPALRRFHIPGGQRYRARDYAVEPDASGAAYFPAAAAITGGRVRVPGLTAASLQGDVGIVDLFERMGCAVDRGDAYLEVRGSQGLHGVDADLSAMSDQTMTIAAVAPFASGPTRIRGVAHIRHQESDRLAATAAGLRRLGQEVEEYDDGLRIIPKPVKPAVVPTCGDHRIAMAFALVGLRVPGVVIADPECVTKTFPDFFDRLETLRQR
jgi:3-phosphoshikimate 1-carboxyvinyltransferase